MNKYMRAYNTKTKEMVYAIHIAPEYGWLVLADNDAMAERERSEDWIIMACTGLKDSKGKDIYEGDIIRWFKDFEFIIGGCKNIEIANFKVVYEQGAFWLNEINSEDPEQRNNRLLRNACENLYEKYDTPLGRVIGNIYKNKKLLTNE